FNEMDAVFFADLRVCQSVACSLADRQFLFQANARGSYRNVHHSVQVEANPMLDVSALKNPTVTDTNDGFLRTYRVEFPDFTGVLDLGFLDAGRPLRLEYLLQARASGLAVFNSAIAAINDPFEVDTDPVRQGAPLTLKSSDNPRAVPEPSTL